MNFSKIFKIFFIAIFFIGLILPLVATAQVKFCAQTTIPGLGIFTKDICTPVSSVTLANMVAGMYKFIAGIAGIAAVIVMMAGGYVWLFAGGNASKVGEAKSLITSAVLGLVLVLGSYMILNLINPELIKLKSLDDITGITPIKLETMSKICSLGEEIEAAQEETKLGNINFDTCGTPYKKRDCMRASCKLTAILQPSDSACVLNADADGKFTGGGCKYVISPYIPAIQKAMIYAVDIAQINPSDYQCGKVDQADGIKSGNIYINGCNEALGLPGAAAVDTVTSCTLINQTGKPSPYIDQNKHVIYYYKESTYPMGCRGPK